ncbi:MAG: DNA polymerase III subunit delta [Actinomycetota bacterium]|nr:DNA polymerase III subunit delta [Actinomycetota bacterium]
MSRSTPPAGTPRRGSTRSGEVEARDAKSTGGLPVHLVKGGDPSLVSAEARRLVKQLVGDLDQALTVDHLDGCDVSPEQLVSACRTLPFLGPLRVVRVRDCGALGTECVSALIEYLADPVPTTSVVLIEDGGATGSKLVAAVKRVGAIVQCQPTKANEKRDWYSRQVAEAGLRLDARATSLLERHLGHDMARAEGLLHSLRSAYGPGAAVSASMLEPFLGEAGDVPPWELTDAIEAGDASAALVVATRMAVAGDRHPLAVLALLHRRFSALLALEGADEASDAEAARMAGIPPFAVRRAVALSRRLGSRGVGEAITLLADADLDLRGASALPGQLVIEILVARLARLFRQAPKAAISRSRTRSPSRSGA